jgi:5-methylthioadenosine/S-adenosylhomocysteine deaminase
VGSLRLAADAVVTCDRDFAVHRPGAVEVGADGRIAWVGPAEPRDRPRRGVLLPGLVNVHCHSPMTLFRGAAEDVPLERFLREVLWPREARLEREDVYWGMTLACAELLRDGVTTTCEMYVHEEAILDAVLAAGARCVLTPGVVDAPGWLPWRERLAQVLAFHDEHANRHERVEIGLAPHSAYGLPLEALDALAAAARERGTLVHVHVAETRDEGRALEAEHGKSVPALLAERGLLTRRTLAAHSVWLSDDDLELYREHDVAVAHCPQSNAKLAAGIAPLADMLRLGLRVGLGTDGPSSNNDLDLWEELRLAALLARLRGGDPEAVPAGEALLLATRGGAEALGRADLGALEPGRWADLMFVRANDPAFVPLLEDRDVVSHLVWSASSRLVSDVWVAGRQVVTAGECVTVDFEQAAREVEQRARRLSR